MDGDFEAGFVEGSRRSGLIRGFGRFFGNQLSRRVRRTID